MKKNLRAIPPAVRAQLKKLGRHVVAAVALPFTAEELRKGTLRHLGIRLPATGELVLPPEGVIIPSPDSGKYSHRNVEGEDIKRTDLPKEKFHIVFESPNFGDSITYGTHTMVWERERYPVEHVPAQFSAIHIGVVKSTDVQYVLAFEVDEVLDREAADFEDRLLRCLNLLQENVGACGVQKSGVKAADFLESLSVSWEILPPGSVGEVVNKVYRGRPPTPKERKIVEDRYNFLMKFGPQKLVFGMSGISRYFGALVRPNLVVFENMAYGNAVYIMFDKWEELSKKSRTELLTGRLSRDFERVPHRDGWKNAVRFFVKKRLEETEGKKKR